MPSRHRCPDSSALKILGKAHPPPLCTPPPRSPATTVTDPPLPTSARRRSRPSASTGRPSSPSSRSPNPSGCTSSAPCGGTSTGCCRGTGPRRPCTRRTHTPSSLFVTQDFVQLAPEPSASAKCSWYTHVAVFLLVVLSRGFWSAQRLEAMELALGGGLTVYFLETISRSLTGDRRARQRSFGRLHSNAHEDLYPHSALAMSKAVGGPGW